MIKIATPVRVDVRFNSKLNIYRHRLVDANGEDLTAKYSHKEVLTYIANALNAQTEKEDEDAATKI